MRRSKNRVDLRKKSLVPVIKDVMINILLSMNVGDEWNKNTIVKMVYPRTDHYTIRSFDANLCRAKKNIFYATYDSHTNIIKRVA